MEEVRIWGRVMNSEAKRREDSLISAKYI